MLRSLLYEARFWPGIWRRRFAYYWLIIDTGNLKFFSMFGMLILGVIGIVRFAYVDRMLIEPAVIQPARIHAEQRQAALAQRRENDLECLAENIYFEARGQALDDALDVGLDQVVVETDVTPELGVGRGGAVGHLNDQPARVPGGGRLEDQRHGRPGRDEVGVHAHLEDPQPAVPVVLPQRLFPFGVPVTAEDVVHQDVEPAVLASDRRDQGGDRRGILVVDDARLAGPARRRRSGRRSLRWSRACPSRTGRGSGCCGRSRIRTVPRGPAQRRSRGPRRAWRPPRARHADR